MSSNAATGDWSLYPYKPNEGAPIAFVIIIVHIAVIQAWQSFSRFHWRVFGGVMTWASLVWVSRWRAERWQCS
jgi:hypothetical protein